MLIEGSSEVVARRAAQRDACTPVWPQRRAADHRRRVTVGAAVIDSTHAIQLSDQRQRVERES